MQANGWLQGEKKMKFDTIEEKRNFVASLKGGVIMDVTTPDEAKIAEDAGAVAVMALERVPADIRAAGGVARMSDPGMIIGIKEAVKIPVMAKCRIGVVPSVPVFKGIIDISFIRSNARGFPWRRALVKSLICSLN